MSKPLEQLVVDRIVEASGTPGWQAFMDLDKLLDGIAAKADDRLAFQSAYPV